MREIFENGKVQLLYNPDNGEVSFGFNPDMFNEYECFLLTRAFDLDEAEEYE